MDIKVGCDPELFLRDTKGNFISAHGLFEGDKKNPQKVNKGAIQVDGMAAEFNIDPATTPEEFSAYVQTVMSELSAKVPGFELMAVPVAEFGEAYMATQPKEALELGCDPDFNAYTGAANERPNANVTFRTGSGHIHIGWTDGADPFDPEHFEACKMLSRELDFTLGYFSMLFDKDGKRRTLYGKAGAFRPKPYGVEYRTLSNAWVKEPALMEWVFRQVKKTFENLAEGKSMYNIWGSWAQQRIDTNDALGCKQNCRAFATKYGFDLELPNV